MKKYLICALIGGPCLILWVKPVSPHIQIELEPELRLCWLGLHSHSALIGHLHIASTLNLAPVKNDCGAWKSTSPLPLSATLMAADDPVRMVVFR